MQPRNYIEIIYHYWDRRTINIIERRERWESPRRHRRKTMTIERNYRTVPEVLAMVDFDPHISTRQIVVWSGILREST